GDRRRAGEELRHRCAAAAHRGCRTAGARRLQCHRSRPRAEPAGGAGGAVASTRGPTPALAARTMAMTRSSGFKVGMGIAVAALAGSQQSAAQAPTLDPSRLPRLGTVDARFQSYNLEMVEVTGGRFWKPYHASASAPSDRDADNSGNVPAGANPGLYAYREPIDLSNPRLRRLAAALAPAYMRVSGTWANTTYFAESDEAPSTPPNGFRAVLSRERWKAVIDFAHAVNAEIVTSMATSPGARDATGQWQSDQARRLFAYTRSVGGRIAAAEF